MFLPDDCPICYTAMEDECKITTTNQCNHSFHSECLSDWMETGAITCPMCRCIISSDDLVSSELKKTPLHYIIFIVWCIQRKLKKKMLSREANLRYMCIISCSHSLEKELKAIWRLSEWELLEKLANTVSSIHEDDDPNNMYTLDNLLMNDTTEFGLPNEPIQVDMNSFSRILNIVNN